MMKWIVGSVILAAMLVGGFFTVRYIRRRKAEGASQAEIACELRGLPRGIWDRVVGALASRFGVSKEAVRDAIDDAAKAGASASSA